MTTRLELPVELDGFLWYTFIPPPCHDHDRDWRITDCMHVIARRSIGSWVRVLLLIFASCGTHVSETRHKITNIQKRRKSESYCTGSYFLAVCELLWQLISIHPQNLPAHLYISPEELDGLSTVRFWERKRKKTKWSYATARTLKSKQTAFAGHGGTTMVQQA